MNILYGKPVKESIKLKLMERIKKLPYIPVLAIVSVGYRDDTSIYLKNKKIFGESVGVKVDICNFNEDITEDELVKEVEKLSFDSNVSGIIIQLPLPDHIDSNKIINLVPKAKDADGLSSVKENTESLIITPATARGVKSLLEFYSIDVNDKKVVVLGRSRLAGFPIATVLSEMGAQVTVCHRDTPKEELPNICSSSDILISATGNPGLITKDFVNNNQVVIDVGINRLDDKIVGDVLFDEVAPLVKSITPVPGGVGLLTVVSLFENLVDLCYNQDINKL